MIADIVNIKQFCVENQLKVSKQTKRSIEFKTESCGMDFTLKVKTQQSSGFEVKLWAKDDHNADICYLGNIQDAKNAILTFFCFP